MPSFNPVTKKRLNGTEQKKYKEQLARFAPPEVREAALAVACNVERQTVRIPQAFEGLQPPPVSDAGQLLVHAIEQWAAGLNIRAAVAAEGADEGTGLRVDAVVLLCRELGRLTVKAARSEKAMKIRKLRIDATGRDAVDLKTPPVDDAVACVVWAYAKLAQLAYEAAVMPEWIPNPRIAASARALAGAGFLPCNEALKDVAARARAAG